VLREALEDGLVHLAPSWRPGASRAVAGVYPGPQPARASDQVLVAALRRAREGAGWSQEALAVRLGITRSTVQRWEEQLVHVPGWASEVAAAVLLEARRARRDLAAAVVAAIDADPGLSRQALARRLGHSRQDGAVREVLRPLLEVGAVHERHAGRRGQQGGLFPGSAPVEVLTPEALRERREALGLLQRDLADHVGAAVTTYQAWEWGISPMTLEGQHQLSAALEALAPTSPRERLRSLLLEVVAEGRGTLHQLYLAAVRADLGGPAAVKAELEVLAARGAVHPGRLVAPSADLRGRIPRGREGFLLGPDPAG